MEYKTTPEDELMFSRVFDAIEGTVGNVWKGVQEASQEGSWLDRSTIIGDDVLRLMGGGLMNTAQAISAIPGVTKLAEFEEWLVERARATNEELTPWLDPRVAGWGTRIASGWITDKGIGKVLKGAKYASKADDVSGLTARITGKIDEAEEAYRLGQKYMEDEFFDGQGVLRRELMTPEEAAYLADKPVMSLGDPSGTPMQRYQAARKRILRAQKEATRKTKGKRVNPYSDTKVFSEAGDARIIEWKNKLTARERELIGQWNKHHRRPLSQNDWMFRGLQGDELLEAQKYSYQRMAAGGDVLSNLAVTPKRPHDFVHKLMAETIGEMRARKGDSIKNILRGEISVKEYLNLKTFAERKVYISRFFDESAAADKRLAHIMNAIDANRINAERVIDLVEINTNIGDPSVLHILDDVIADITFSQGSVPGHPLANTLWDINNELRDRFIDYNRLLDKADEAHRLGKHPSKALRRQIEFQEKFIENLQNKKRKYLGTDK